MLKKILEYLTNLCYSIFKISSSGAKEMKDEGISVFDVANFFRSKEKMTHKKLQKLVYYAYAWYITLNNDDKDKIENKLFNNCNFEAWVHGPVCPILYQQYSNNYGMVDKYRGKLNENINGEIKKFLELIYKTFGNYTGDELESMTHKEMPWQNARDSLKPYEPSNNIIQESDMFVYYNSL